MFGERIACRGIDLARIRGFYCSTMGFVIEKLNGHDRDMFF